MNEASGFSDDRRPPEDATFADVVNGFTFGSGRKKRKRSRKQEESAERTEVEPTEAERIEAERIEREPTGPQRIPDPPASPSEPAEAPASSIRSYTWTGGRTRSRHQLELETLVSTSSAYAQTRTARMEHQSIAELCHHPKSVAEVGALLGVPVGVARVLLADMAELGLITVHQTVSESGSAPHLMLMERVLSGLRRL